MISLTLRVRCIVAIAAALVPISWAFGQAPGTGGGDRNYPALTYRSPSNIENILDVVTIGGKTYLVDRQFDGKLNGMMQRVFADGTVQFEEWESGRLLQVGLRGPFSSTIAPQTQARGQARGAPATRSGAPETGADQWQCNDKAKSRYQISITPTSLRIPGLTSSTQDTVLQKQADGSFLHQDRPGSEAYKTIIRFQGADKLNMAFTNLQGAVNLTYDCARATQIKTNRP